VGVSSGIVGKAVAILGKKAISYRATYRFLATFQPAVSDDFLAG
jgi:hypothetical protein